MYSGHEMGVDYPSPRNTQLRCGVEGNFLPRGVCVNTHRLLELRSFVMRN